MAESQKVEVGAVGWIDLTVPNALHVRNFYSEVVGWTAEPVPMGGYEDFNMKAPSGRRVAGICHARGLNATLPAQWLMYITVADLERSIRKCIELGGTVIAGPRNLGPNGRFCVIRDPGGAVAGLYSPAP